MLPNCERYYKVSRNSRLSAARSEILSTFTKTFTDLRRFVMVHRIQLDHKKRKWKQEQHEWNRLMGSWLQWVEERGLWQISVDPDRGRECMLHWVGLTKFRASENVYHDNRWNHAKNWKREMGRGKNLSGFVLDELLLSICNPLTNLFSRKKVELQLPQSRKHARKPSRLISMEQDKKVGFCLLDLGIFGCTFKCYHLRVIPNFAHRHT